MAVSRSCLAACLFLALTGTAAAADPPPGALPPRMLGEPAPEYPAAAEALGLEATVTLLVSIDATGQVTDAEVVEPVGHGFDEAAIAAVLATRFAPAQVNGQPVPARIRQTITFRLAAAPAEVPPAPAPPPPPQPEAPPEKVIDVTVRGQSDADRRRRSAEAVTVIDTEIAQRESADLGEVLARTQGMSVRRSGGLGSYTRISLNGLRDEQIRFFIDGVPFTAAGYANEVTDLPLGLVQNVIIYRGVLPVRFGADALGGGIEIISERRERGVRAYGSYESGSYGVHRALAAFSQRTGSDLYFSGSAFLDWASNAYDVDVPVADDRGRITEQTVPRFHDDYTSMGLRLEAGALDKPWARKLRVSGLLSSMDKDWQHNLVMTLPYGEVEYGTEAASLMVRYEQPLAEEVDLATTLVYGRRNSYFTDTSEWVYDWYGRRIRMRARPGEINGEPIDQDVWFDTLYGNLYATWRIAPEQFVRAIAVPYVSFSGGTDRTTLPGSRDQLDADRRLVRGVFGVEHEIHLFDDRLENITFAKAYHYSTRSQEILPGDVAVDRSLSTFDPGAGTSLRYTLTPWSYLKGSYEYTARLPEDYEVFGDGALVLANLGLSREQSHNANLSATIDARKTGSGEWRADLNLFLRAYTDGIVLLGNDRFFTYQNLSDITARGVEMAGGWTSPGELFSIDLNGCYNDQRNTSTTGPFAPFEGDRLPNWPWLTANLSARLTWKNVTVKGDELSLGGYSRYVHEFFRGWESVGLQEFKQTIPTQLSHTLTLTYYVRGRQDLTTSVEVQNLTDAEIYDTYGAQKPGRAIFFKATVEYQK